ncbi:FAD-dependent monooxygenase [Saccharopolyspora sp. NPDC002686]|uniref:FAD-dependent monooxygenase n=1 Tax=Saccharopolyspora sp. NPDC002686 TaxID=3154541 RepID=UPI00331BD230
MGEGSAGRVLVVGMGVSGTATAARLRAAGWTPVIVERAAQRRSGGYFIVLFGAGHEAAKRLGILEHMHDRAGSKDNLDIDRRGGASASASFSDLLGDPWLMLRGDVEQAAHAALPDDVEVRFSTVPTAIEQDADGVDVTLLDTASGAETTERFDLVVGADGVRSTVRSLVFGPHEDYLQRLGYMIAAFECQNTPPGLVEGQSATMLEPGRSMWIFAFSDHNPTTLLTYKTDDVDAEFSRPPAERLRAAFGPEPLGESLTSAIAEFEASDQAVFDSVEQVRMDSWHRGRVVLVGDSAWCVTLYTGMGASSGLMGADLLGTALEQHDDVETALAEWERSLRPYIDFYLDKAAEQRKLFVADSRLEIRIRKLASMLAKIPFCKPLVARMLQIDSILENKGADIIDKMLTTLSGANRRQRDSVAESA